MNRSFNGVINSPINISRTKCTYGFSQSARIPPTKKLACERHCYNITNDERKVYKKKNCFGIGERFKTTLSRSPSPNTYNLKNSMTERISNIHNKNLFGKQQRLKLIPNNNPGPGSYLNNNPQGFYSSNQHKLSYNTGSYLNKISSRKIPSNTNQSLHSYLNRQSALQDKKFLNNVNSFGKSARFKTQNSFCPGPGRYEYFSQFSQLNKDCIKPIYHSSSIRQ